MVLVEILGTVAASVVVLLFSRIAQIEERFPRRLGLDSAESDKIYTYYGGAEKAEFYFKLNNIFELKMKSQSAAEICADRSLSSSLCGGFPNLYVRNQEPNNGALDPTVFDSHLGQT